MRVALWTKPISEGLARFVVISVFLGVPLAVGIGYWSVNSPPGRENVEIHARIPEDGGWMPSSLIAAVGQPLRLRLISDDVVHGFAVGQSDVPAIDVMPGQPSEAILVFDRPGKYTFYCTRWCGPNHWRMRGTIEVTGANVDLPEETFPLYLSLRIDIDAPHPAAVIPQTRPSAARGATAGATIPAKYLGLDYYRSHSPADIWQALRTEPSLQHLNDADLWDLVAYVWQRNTSLQDLEEGRKLYTANCAACHGEVGRGNGVMADSLPYTYMGESENGVVKPASFAASTSMLGASPALLQGKILRGGMGTGMPYWGPILNETQTWALVDYLWTFQFEPEADQ